MDESEPHFLMTMLLRIKFTHVKLETFRPLSNNFISGSAVDIHLVLEKIVPSRCISVLIERDGRPGAPYERKNQTQKPNFNTVRQNYCESITNHEKALTCLADNKTPLFAFPLRTETKVSLVVIEIQTTCAPQANSGA